MAQTLNYDPKPLTFPGLRLPPAPTTPPFFNGDPGQGDPRNGAVASGWQRTQWGVGATPPQSSRPPPLLIWACFYALGWLASALALECVKGGVEVGIGSCHTGGIGGYTRFSGRWWFMCLVANYACGIPG